ncbi:MAG: hypothetical protein ABR936_11830 [Bacteroidota bacterium]|jgi:DNA polymerase/3'-5' exonuclease PolX
MQLKQAENIARKYVALLSPLCDRIEVAGSVRRQKPEVNDIEIVAIPSGRTLEEYFTLVNQWYKVKGDACGKYTQRKLPEGIYLDLFHATPKNWGMIYAIRTGSDQFSHNVLAVGWKKKGFKSQGGVLYDDNTHRAKFIYEEEDLFKLIGVPFVEPHLRELYG